MTGLLAICAVFLALMELQKLVSWLPGLILVGIGVRYAIVTGVFNMSKFRHLTDITCVLNDPEDPQQAGDRIFSDEVFTALEQIGEEMIFGQEHVLKPLIGKIKANSQIPGRERPFVTAAFFGPPGVGKTTLAEQVCQAIFKSQQYYNRIDSSQYKDYDSSSLYGTSKSYIGCETYGAITNWLREKGEGVLLIDEPDRVNGDPKRWIQTTMPILDGRVTEVSTKEEFSTRNTAIFFASNYEHEKLGLIAKKYHSLQGTMPPAELAAGMRKEVMAVLEGSVFPKAFLDRLDFIGVFAPLTTEVMADILLKEIYLLTTKNHMEVEFIDPDILKSAVRVGKAGKSTGARDFKRWVEENVNPALVDANLQKAQKVKLLMGPDGKAYAAITQSREEPAANPSSRAKARP